MLKSAVRAPISFSFPFLDRVFQRLHLRTVGYFFWQESHTVILPGTLLSLGRSLLICVFGHDQMPMAPSVTPLWPIPQSRYGQHSWMIITMALPGSQAHETLSQRKCWATGSMPEDELSRRTIPVLSLGLVPHYIRNSLREKEARKRGYKLW